MNDMTIYCFDGWRLDVGQRRLLNPNGDNVHITNRDFDILVMFCEHPKQLVPRGSLAARSDGKAPTAIVRLIVASPASGGNWESIRDRRC